MRTSSVYEADIFRSVALELNQIYVGAYTMHPCFPLMHKSMMPSVVSLEHYPVTRV